MSTSISDLSMALTLGGFLHFAILLASALVPSVLSWREELAKVAPLMRQLVWVHGAFIVLTIVGFGAVTLVSAEELAGGTPAARAFCAFVALFWLARLGLQFFVFDARPYLNTLFLRAGYHGLTVVFAYLALVYATAAVLP